MTDQPNTETDAEFVERFGNMALYEGDSGLELSEDDHVRASELLRRAVAPAPAGDVEQRVRALRWKYMPGYGEISWRELQEAIAEAQYADRKNVKEISKDIHIGHEMVTGVNFNSLNRIVTAFARAALAVMPAHAADVRRRTLIEAAEIADAREEQQERDHGAVNTGGAAETASDIRAAADAAPREDGRGDGWLPIESARKDGKRLWLFYPGAAPDDQQRVGWWEVDRLEEPGWIDHADSENGDPTHWRPLPPAPQEPRR